MIEKFEDLMDQAYLAPEGKVKISILEEAIRIADVHLGPDEQFDTRMELVNTAIFSGHGEKAIVAFAWCLAHYDKHPESTNDYQMMWSYKWVADRLLLFPDIELAKVESTFEDLKKRFIQTGYGPHYYYYLKHALAMNLEKTDEAEYYYEKWITEPSDSLSDCYACTLANKTKGLLYLGKTEEAFAVAEPILAGHASCHSVPHRTYADLLLPLLKEGRKTESDEYYQKCYELIYNQTGFLETAIQLLMYLSITDTAKAVAFLEKYFPEAYETDESIVKYNFYIIATAIWNMLDEHASQTIQLPHGVPIEEIKQEMHRLAALFDKQNQTNVYTNKISIIHTQIHDLKKIYNK
jgi:hypothetical protein